MIHKLNCSSFVHGYSSWVRDISFNVLISCIFALTLIVKPFSVTLIMDLVHGSNIKAMRPKTLSRGGKESKEGNIGNTEDINMHTAELRS